MMSNVGYPLVEREREREGEGEGEREGHTPARVAVNDWFKPVFRPKLHSNASHL